MPELPDITVYLEALRPRIVGRVLDRITVRSPFLLRTFEPPLQVPGFEMGMFWHERRHRDPGHRWLREQILDAMHPGRRGKDGNQQA